MNLPNLISLARLLSVPVVVWLILSGWMATAFWAFVAAGISDAVDGFIAKRFDAQTTIGIYLDPIADKVLLVSVYLALGYHEHIASWLVILVVFRDLLIIGGALLMQTLMQRQPPIAPLRISKVNTALQIVLACLVLASLGYALPAHPVTFALTHLVAATTLASGAAYLWRWARGVRQIEGAAR